MIIDRLYSGKLPPALTPNLFLKWLVLQAQDRMASLRKTYFKKSQKELQLSHNNVTFPSGDFSLSCGATANLPPWSAVVKVNLDFFYTIRVQASDLLNILTGQSPGRICLSIGSCSLHTTLCSSGTHLDKLNFLCSCYKLDKLVNLFHLVATLHKRNCFFATLLNSV